MVVDVGLEVACCGLLVLSPDLSPGEAREREKAASGSQPNTKATGPQVSGAQALLCRPGQKGTSPER
jgi:hypothetical protein